MQGSAPRDVGRPSKIAQYLPQIAQWLREHPDVSSSEILRRVRLAGYLGGKSALYELIRRLRVPGSGYRRCPRCRALLRDIAEVCQHCGSRLPPTALHPPILDAEALRAARARTEAQARHQAPALPPVERYLVVAASDRQELYEYFKRKLGRAEAIEVVRERRMADRRERVATVPVDRRRRDRRSGHALDADLRAFGFAIVIRD